MPDERGVTWRPADKSDKQLLQSFECTTRTGLGFEKEVQTWIRRDAITESNRGYRADQRVLLVFDDGELIAVGSHARWENEQGQVGRLLIVGAVRLDKQGKQLSDGTRASEALMEVVLNDIVDRDDPPPGWVVAKVHKENARSLALCNRFGLTSEQKLSSDLVLRAGPFPERSTTA